MLDHRFAFHVVWGTSAVVVSLIAGFVLGSVAAVAAAYGGWDGEIVFQAVYSLSALTTFFLLMRSESFV